MLTGPPKSSIKTLPIINVELQKPTERNTTECIKIVTVFKMCVLVNEEEISTCLNMTTLSIDDLCRLF